MKFRIYIASAVAVMIVSSCGNRLSPTESGAESMHFTSKDEISPQTFTTWKNSENGLTRKRSFGDLVFQLSYNPSEWMALKSIGATASTHEIQKESEHYSELLYFTLRIALIGEQTEPLKYKEGDLNYNQRVEYFSFGIQRDLALVTNKGDTIPCGISHFERAYSSTNYCDILLGFSKKQVEEFSPGWKKATVVYSDKIFKKGEIRFSFSKNQLTNTPKIKVP